MKDIFKTSLLLKALAGFFMAIPVLHF